MSSLINFFNIETFHVNFKIEGLVPEPPQPLVQSQEMELTNFKLPQTTESTRPSQGYKFSPPSTIPKFTSQVCNFYAGSINL